MPDRVAGDIVERFGFAHIARFLPDDDEQFGFIVEFIGDLAWRQFDRRVVRCQGVVIFVEKDRRLGEDHAGFLGVSPVIEANADDLAWIGEEPAIGNLGFINHCSLESGRVGFLGECIESAGVARSQQFFQRDRGMTIQNRVRLGDVEDASRCL